MNNRSRYILGAGRSLLSGIMLLIGGSAFAQLAVSSQTDLQQLAASILQKEQRIAEIMGNIRNLLAKHSK